MTINEKVMVEALRAHIKYGPFTSHHEGFGVLYEEVRELSDAIRSNDPSSVRREAIQVAAVAMRIAQCCSVPAFRRRSGMDERQTKQ